MNRTGMAAAIAVCCASMLCLTYAQGVARLNSLEGNVSLLRTGGEKWIPARVSMSLAAGDQIYTRSESFAEIIYPSGAVVRMAEETKLTIVAVNDKSSTTKSSIGNVWVNMRKLVKSGGKEFELSTPTATAAIRGTVFDMTCNKDSSTNVSVFEGKVAVGPGDALAKQTQAKPAHPPQERVEVPGPEEIPGPYEVTLAEWQNIVAGQRISVRADGKFAQEAFDLKAADKDAFVKKNLDLDKKLGSDHK